jgi:hypothetical protein
LNLQNIETSQDSKYDYNSKIIKDDRHFRPIKEMAIKKQIQERLQKPSSNPVTMRGDTFGAKKKADEEHSFMIRQNIMKMVEQSFSRSHQNSLHNSQLYLQSRCPSPQTQSLVLRPKSPNPSPVPLTIKSFVDQSMEKMINLEKYGQKQIVPNMKVVKIDLVPKLPKKRLVKKKKSRTRKKGSVESEKHEEFAVAKRSFFL